LKPEGIAQHILVPVPLAKRRTVALHELRDEMFLTYVAGYAPGRDVPILKACRDASV